jgi:hypothetical protein
MALMDGDIVTYRIGFASETVPWNLCRARVDEFLSDILLFDLDADDIQGYLTGPGNFREQLAVTAPYKGNRTGNKPKHYAAIREYLQDTWGFQLIEGQEADDEMAIQATIQGSQSVICTIDKDLDQVEGWHYNFVKRTLYYVDELQGLRNFYCQVLTGDRIDNVIGLRGIGPAKASKLLEGASTPQEMYDRCVRAYGGDSTRVNENGALLWLRRFYGQVWCPPQSLPASSTDA